MAKAKPEVRFTVSEELKNRFNTACDDYMIDHPESKKSDFLAFLLDQLTEVKSNGQSFDDLLTDDESEVLKAVRKTTDNHTVTRLMVTGIIGELKRFLSQSETRSQFANMSYRELVESNSRVRGYAEEKIKRVIEALISYNDGCEDIGDKIFISSVIVSDITKANRAALTSAFNDSRTIEKLEAHHNKHGLVVSHNRVKTRKNEDIVKDIKGQLGVS